MSHAAAFRRTLVEGAVNMAPILLGVIPFGLVAGVVAVDTGLGLAEASGFSTLVFAGASQLAAMDLLGDGAPVAVAIGTALVINLRFLMYSAALTPHLAGEPLRRRTIGAYLLTDQAFALSLVRFREQDDPAGRWPYYLGGAITLWVAWQAATIAGVFIGDAVPDSVPLRFAVPITFLALLLPTVTDRATIAAAVVAGATAVAAAGLPANLGMITAAATGIGVGFLVSELSAA